MKLLDYFDSFMTNTVNLDQPRLDELAAQVDAIYAIASNDDALGPHVEDYIRTGSWAHRTIIKPVRNKDFDGDILLQIEEVEGWEPVRYFTETRDAFLRDEGTRDLTDARHDRCVRIDLSDVGHIDVVPYIVRTNAEDGDEEESIVNAATNEFEETSPRGLAEWVRDNDRLANGYLRKTIRLMKYLRDYKATFSIPSIILTTLLGEQVHSWDTESDYSDLPTAFRNILTDLNRWLGSNATMPEIEDPSCPGVSFTHRWNDARYQNFRTQIERYQGWVEEAYDEPNREKSLAAWQRVFGDDFKAPASAVAKAATEVAESSLIPWKAPVAGEDNIQDIAPWIGGNQARIIARAVPPSSRRGRPRNILNIKRLPKGMDIRFTVETNIRGPYKLYWKVRNSGDDAVRANDLRGNIFDGTPDAVHTEVTKYRGEHKIECFLVVNGRTVAYAWHPVTIV